MISDLNEPLAILFMTARAWLVLAGVVVAAIAVWPAGRTTPESSTSRIVIRGRTVDAEINALGRDYEKAAGVRITETASGAVNAVALAVMAPSCSPMSVTTLPSLPATVAAKPHREARALRTRMFS